MDLCLKDLTDKQKQAWKMRYQYGWRMRRIALEMGTTTPAVSRMLRRAQRRAGLCASTRVSVIRTKPRVASLQSLSDAFEF